MAGKPKAASPPQAAKRRMTPEEQSERFIKAAQELGVDESGAEFERAFSQIVDAVAKSIDSKETSTSYKPYKPKP